MIKTKLIVIALLASLLATAQQKNIFTNAKVSYEQLKAGFTNTPNEARLRCYWWWLNSMATQKSITRDLEEMKDKGYGGASIVDAGSSNYQVAKKNCCWSGIHESRMDGIVQTCSKRGRTTGNRVECQHSKRMESGSAINHS